MFFFRGQAKDVAMNLFRFRAFLLPSLIAGVMSLTANSAHAQSSASLHGRATGADGKPLSNAVVQLVSDQTHGGHARRYTLIGDALGKFSQEGLAPGAYLVMLFTDGKGTNLLRSVQLKAGDERAVDLVLTPTVELAGTSSTDERGRISGRTR